MILYLDTSALFKRFVREKETAAVEALAQQAEQTGASLLARAEMSAAIAKARRMGWLGVAAAEKVRRQFRAYWPKLAVVQITPALIALADDLAWERGLRGYDAVHLASALTWQKALGESITLATFDRQLWQAAPPAGLLVWPEKLD